MSASLATLPTPCPCEDAAPVAQGEGFCGNSQNAYADMLCSLLPSGAAWPAQAGIQSKQKSLMTALAIGFKGVGDQMCHLIDESDPCQSIDLLPDWERLFGLPDPCLRTEIPAPWPFAPYQDFQAGDEAGEYLYRAVQASSQIIDNNPTTLTGRQAAVCARARAQGGASPAYFASVFAAAGQAITIETQAEFQAGSQAGEYLYMGGGDGQFVAIHTSGAAAWTDADKCLMARIAPAHLEPVFA